MSEQKTKSIEQALEQVSQLAQQGSKVCIALGAFDILNITHLEYLEECKALGDYLFVLVYSSKLGRSLLDGYEPILSEADRMELVGYLEVVDMAVLLDELKHLDKLSAMQDITVRLPGNDPGGLALALGEKSISLYKVKNHLNELLARQRVLRLSESRGNSS